MSTFVQVKLPGSPKLYTYVYCGEIPIDIGAFVVVPSNPYRPYPTIGFVEALGKGQYQGPVTGLLGVAYISRVDAPDIESLVEDATDLLNEGY